MGGVLKKGSSGPRVVEIQRELQKRGSPKLPATGYYGTLTEEAVRKFQKAAGFEKKDIDGRVGNQTLMALFPVVQVKLNANLIPQPHGPYLKFDPPPPPSAIGSPTPTPAPTTGGDDNQPRWLQGQGQVGGQLSPRDGLGATVSGALTLRFRDYKGGKLGHAEVQGQVQVGLPSAGSSIYTGQYSLNVQPFTDLLVLPETSYIGKTHYVNAFANLYYQGPYNKDPAGSTNAAKDLAAHPRAGINVGANLIQLDLRAGASLILTGQLALYRDLQDHDYHLDPQLMLNLQFPLASWFKQ
jgi:peptidoglycan hydrolase-like protein with peptidoglycan-binding domain